MAQPPVRGTRLSHSIRRYENYKFDIKEKDSEKKLAAYLKG